MRDRHPGDWGRPKHLGHKSDSDRGGDRSGPGGAGDSDHGGGDLQEKERPREMSTSRLTGFPAQGGDDHQPGAGLPTGPQVAAQTGRPRPRQRPHHTHWQRQQDQPPDQRVLLRSQDQPQFLLLRFGLGVKHKLEPRVELGYVRPKASPWNPS